MGDAKVDIFDDYSLEGDMSVPSTRKNTTELGQPDFNTLDEPIKETIMRDLNVVGRKFYHVLYPKEKIVVLKEWDLWGPLILSIFISVILHGNGVSGGPDFSLIFALIWFGAAIVTLNTKLLGGNISIFQSICVLGYCLTPLAIALVLCRIVLIAGQSTILDLLRLILTLAGFGWTTYSAHEFLGESQPANRKRLCIGVMCVYYLTISWLIFAHTVV